MKSLNKLSPKIVEILQDLKSYSYSYSDRSSSRPRGPKSSGLPEETETDGLIQDTTFFPAESERWGVVAKSFKI